jgi:hypothetical protein
MPSIKVVKEPNFKVVKEPNTSHRPFNNHIGLSLCQHVIVWPWEGSYSLCGCHIADRTW